MLVTRLLLLVVLAAARALAPTGRSGRLRDLVGSAPARWQRKAGSGERGDVPGWVLITVMAAGLVTVLWQLAGPKLSDMLDSALSSVTGG